ncbi:MAG TPA: glycosyltransferase [Myxococcota bacterium]
MGVRKTLQRNWIEVPLYVARGVARQRARSLPRPAYRIAAPIRVYKTYREQVLGLADCLRSLGHTALVHPIKRLEDVGPLRHGDRVVTFGTYRLRSFEREPGVLYAAVNAEFYGSRPDEGMMQRTREFVDRCDLLFESNEVSLRQARDLGLNPSGLMPFAWTPRLDWRAAPSAPRYDIAFLGRIEQSEHRLALREEIRSRFNACPYTVAWGRGRARFLRRARIQLSLNQGSTDHFPGHRFALALANRCFILSEPLPDEAPFRAGVHYAAAPLGEIAQAIEFYLKNPESMRRIAEAGHRFFRCEYRLIDYAEHMCKTMDAAWDTLRSGARLAPIRADLLRSERTG